MQKSYEIGLPYACPHEQIWTPEEEAKLPNCDFCWRRCDNIFMRVFYSNAPTQNYCSAYCWHEGREVDYYDVKPQKKGKFLKELSKLKEN